MKISRREVLDLFEEAPHIELNQDGSTIDLSNWNEPANRNWSYRHTVDVLPYTQRISRGDGAAQEFGEKQIDISSMSC